MIYFLRSPSTKLIKIGRSSHFRSRLATLEYEADERLEILGVLHEPDSVETDLHRAFRGCRMRGEWFEETPALIAYIRKHSHPYSPSDSVGQVDEIAVKIDRVVWIESKQAARAAGMPVGEWITQHLRRILARTQPQTSEQVNSRVLS